MIFIRGGGLGHYFLAADGFGYRGPWDTISVCYFHKWWWNEEALLGIWIDLPLEECLFMVLVPMMLIGASLIFKIELHKQDEKLD